MTFSSLSFLFIFFPVVFLLYALIPRPGARNLLLAAASLVFYAFGEPVAVLIMLLSILLNYMLGRAAARPRGDRAAVALAAILNIGLLAVYKYAGFFTGIFNSLSGLSLPVPRIRLPIGISFFTFQGLSYTIDVYRRPEDYSRSFLKLLLYISFFPQLIAGPIVRWGDISAQIDGRCCTAEKTSSGVRRFIVGLSKKLLLADTAAVVVDAVFGSAAVDSRLAWLGGICYTLQIYFDFSGYSDMAIGMGRMFGFSIRENFLFPYTATSIRDFWRKWHISLSSWFREYLYFPLGGSRCSRGRAALNRLLVFFCTGLWHGANWTFVLWGLGHGLLSSLEGSGIIPVDRLQKSLPGRLLCRVYTLLSVMLLFTLFRADTVAQGVGMIAAMFRFRALPAAAPLLAKLSTPAASATLCAALALALSSDGGRIHAFLTEERTAELLPDLCCLLLLVLSVMSLAQSGFHPFIYFQF